MPKPNDRLASALHALKTLQDAGLHAIPGQQLARADREALQRAGFLKPVLRGWYIPSRPDDAAGDTTPWYAGMREFIAGYATQRYGDHWHVNPEQSLLLRSGARTLPVQIQIWAEQGTNQGVPLLHGCSLFVYRAARLLPASPEPDCGGLRLVDLPAALVAASPTFYTQHATAAQIALSSLPDASDVLRILLDGPHPAVAGRLTGALRAIGRDALADDIVGAMGSAGYAVNEVNPFMEEPSLTQRPGPRPESPYVQRLRLMWAQMRAPVMRAFPPATGAPRDIDALLADVAARYVTDAYHSLSIEGYRVTATLVERVREGNWHPDSGADRTLRDAMAARGYFDAHNLVRADLVRAARGANAGAVLRNALPRWYQALFGPAVQAGILRASDLAGYRSGPVFIRGAQHVPPSSAAVRDCMPVLFELLAEEDSPAVRAVLGHFAFVYIHPFMDGNGRLARFLMNLMLASAGYAWTVIPVERRGEYMDALAQASSHSNITPFARLVARLAKAQARSPLPRPR